MKYMPDPGIFKPAPSRIETKSDATTRVAREIIDSEAKTRLEKTERLRAARLAQVVSQGEAPVSKAARRKR